MENIKAFRIEHTPTYGEIEVEINLDFVNKIKNKDGEEKSYPIMESIKSMVDFWTGSEKRLDENDGDYLQTFLKQLCHEVITLVSTDNLSAAGVIEEMKGKEGWCPIDGSYGIKLLSVTAPDFSTQNEYEITELDLATKN